MTETSKGEIGELIVSNFFDSNFSKIFSFTSPKTKNNAEVADVLIWLNRTVFLIEVKTRNMAEGRVPIESWCHSKIKMAHSQIQKNISRIKANEKIFINNKYYHSELDCVGISRVIGLIVLVHDEECNITPSEYLKNIYSSKEQIHVVSWNDLEKMIEEIQTTPDLIYYLKDRYEYLKKGDIRLGEEMNVIGYYKTHNNSFPNKEIDFSDSNYFTDYKTTMKSEIEKRNEHNENAKWIGSIENLFTDQRKLMIGIPSGLLFSWELGMLSQRERAYYGEKISSVQQWFIDGNEERYFSYKSGSTSNWLLFYFTQLEEKVAFKELKKLTELKLIKEIEENSFEFGIYSICFSVSKTYPHLLMGVIGSTVMGCDVVEGKYSKEDVELAFKKFGKPKPFKIQEFPDS